jgi:hypothetical protein
MKKKKKLIPSINKQSVICLVLLLSLAHAKDAVDSALSSNSIDETTQINGKAVKGKTNETIKKSQDNSFNEIMSTKGGCTASCCANNQMNEKASYPDKTDKKKAKRKRSGLFSWFK